MVSRTTAQQGQTFAEQRCKAFLEKYGHELVDAHAQFIHLQPSVEAVAQTLSPDMVRARWISESSYLRAMLLQLKRPPLPEAIRAVGQGLGDAPPQPVVDSCIGPPYSLSEVGADGNLFSGPSEGGISAPGEEGEFAPGASASKSTGKVHIFGNCWNLPFNPVGVRKASAFVGQDFPVPAGPTRYEVTISYDWFAFGSCFASWGGLATANANLAILIDKRDGTKQTLAREVSLLTVPFFAGDSFTHQTTNAQITIPFTRDGSNGTVRIMVGADGHCTAIGGFFCMGSFDARANVREICVRASPDTAWPF